MSDKAMCPQCGGLVYATVGGLGERLCTCTEKSGPLPVEKICISCGKDVTNDRRMKDKDGKYWCLACGIEDQKKKQHNSQICPDCNQKYQRDKMEVVEGAVVCQGCAILRRRTTKGLKKRLGISSLHHKESHKVKISMAIAALLLLAAALVYINL